MFSNVAQKARFSILFLAPTFYAAPTCDNLGNIFPQGEYRLVSDLQMDYLLGKFGA
jgi:hypothetical protein